MPEINNIVKFNKEMQSLINTKVTNSSFTHLDWGQDDLQAIRSYIRSHYRNEQKGRCSYCRGVLSLRSAANCHVEHITPKSKYLKFIFEAKNLCVACADCNEIKREQETLGTEPDPLVDGDIRVQYPRSSNAFKIVHPHFDNYNDHIKIFNGYYVDSSPKGHFTIGACKLNRHLHEFGWEEDLVSEDHITEIMNEYLECSDSLSKNSILQKLKRILVMVR
ncbi:HNH endonuclease [Shewanella oncorhynchi]|uniref:HNH endonuclease n=1 Tax=Shewanella oncorhynchi TaxID=2726434 RepID=UPI003D7B0D38